MVLYRLYKPETQYHEGKHVRDLSKLNRDLSQVCVGLPVDWTWSNQARTWFNQATPACVEVGAP